MGDPVATRRTTGLVIAATALTVAVVGVLALMAPGADASPSDPRLHWRACGDGFECTTANVPLDHEGAQGGSIQLALIRLPAGQPDERLGSLFLNPGGPGGSGVDLLRNAAPFFPAPVRAQYDLVGFDPRGVARSTPARCFGSLSQSLQALAPFPFPVTEEEQALQEAADGVTVAACDQRGRRIIDHMTTADVARDLEVLRAAVGDERLNFLGMSYGTYLGVTYANLFPDRVGRIVLDGVLDPVAWATGHPGEAAVPFSTRVRSHEGSQETLEEFFRLCDESAAAGPVPGQSCPFGPASAARFDALATALLDGPVQGFSYAQLVSVALEAMYEPVLWPTLADLLASLELVVAGDPAVPAADLEEQFSALQSPGPPGIPAYPNVVEAFPGVACSDSDNPASYDAWAAAAATTDADSYFGSRWTWLSSICALWPSEGPNRYSGPWTAATDQPVLLVNPRYDPATPFHGAEVVNSLLPNTNLVTYEGWGHIALARTGCVDAAVAAHLLGHDTGDVTCPEAPSPFAPPPIGLLHAQADDVRFPEELRRLAPSR